MILEFTLKNRDFEIKRLKTELEEVKLFKCDECDYSAARESELKTHMKTIHEVVCSHCNCTCAGENKFRNHICKVQVENPLSEQFGFYTKDWFERKKCIRVFDNASKEEVIMLHSENCIEHKVCSELPSNFLREKYFKDTHGMIHLAASNYMESNNIKSMNILGMRIMLNSI